MAEKGGTEKVFRKYKVDNKIFNCTYRYICK